MDKKNIIPQTSKPVMRVSCGTQTDLFAELSEEVLSDTLGVTSLTSGGWSMRLCSMDDDAS